MTSPDYYVKEDSFFGSKRARLKFLLHAEQVMLNSYSSQMNTHAYTNMSIDLQELLQKHVFLEEQFCFSGYHYSVMILSALDKRLKQGPKEDLFMMLQGENGLDRIQSGIGRSGNSTMSDSLFRIDAVQKDFGQSHSYRLFSRLKKLFPLVLKYAPPFEEIAREINRTIRLPKGIIHEGCHFGVKSKSSASFDSQSRFFDDDMHLRPLTVDDDLVTRWHEPTHRRKWKRNYFVMLNVCLNLRRGSKRLQFHVPISIISFAVVDVENGKYIHPKLVRLPRSRKDIFSADMYTIFVYFLYSFNSTQLLLAGAAAALHMLNHVSLHQLDVSITNRDKETLHSIYNSFKLASLTAEQTKLVFFGMRKTADAFMASEVMSWMPVYRVNFISPETVEGG
tara:strand:- start:4550 stop:5728 length:1179 start_codon:yes stop_codon:yes gene_type:complete